jgi:hypothetical protein
MLYLLIAFGVFGLAILLAFLKGAFKGKYE